MGEKLSIVGGIYLWIMGERTIGRFFFYVCGLLLKRWLIVIGFGGNRCYLISLRRINQWILYSFAWDCQKGPEGLKLKGLEITQGYSGKFKLVE